MMMLVLSETEQAALDEVRRAGAFRTNEDAVKGALYWYARFLDLDIDPSTFAMSLPPAPIPVPVPDENQGQLFQDEQP